MHDASGRGSAAGAPESPRAIADPWRVEEDSLGPVRVPGVRLYGPQTQRAVENFRLSGRDIGSMPELIRALAWVKKAAATVNAANEEIPAGVAQAIIAACDELIEGQWLGEFPVDVLQGGAGTSTNMNANEVIANRALELLGLPRGRYDVVHPLDHVNRSQSTNDAYATAVRLACWQMNDRLIGALTRLAKALRVKAVAFSSVPKLGRTQLQDAVPMTLGREFEAFARTIAEDIERARETGRLFLEVNLGGTAIGTGVGASQPYGTQIVEALRSVSGIPVAAAEDLIEASWDMGAFVLYSGLLKRVAAKLSKISNDLRLLSSGPAGGLGEIRLPKRQPGSSLMPGKVNPVIPESVNQVAFRVFGLDTSITFAAEGGQLQLNAFEPLIMCSIHEGVVLLERASDNLARLCIQDLQADPARCARNLASSTADVTSLVPLLGYARAAEIAAIALQDGRPVREILEALEPELAALRSGV